MVQAHYQLLNTLQLSKGEVQTIVQNGLNYVHMLNTDPDVMRFHLKFTENNDDIPDDNVMKNKNDVVYKLLNYDCDFSKTGIYYDFKKEVCRSYIRNMKKDMSF